MTQQIPHIHEKYIFFLNECLGASDVRHSGRTLFEHLKGTYEILAKQDASQDVCLAGLFHSIYGTSYFKHASLDSKNPSHRALVRELIGERAEHLAYIFSTLSPGERKALFNWSDIPDKLHDLPDLRRIELANLQEQDFYALRSNKKQQEQNAR